MGKPLEITAEVDVDFGDLYFTDIAACDEGRTFTRGEVYNFIEKSAYDIAIAALREATDIIHSDFCGTEHHSFCIKFNQILKNLGEIDG